MKKITIIIPVYNVSHYIEECIESVMSQTYSENVECLIVDDCGQDDSMERAQNAIKSYKGPISFHIIHHDINRGLSASRNTGINHSRGEYLFFLDSDDILKNDCLVNLINVIKNHPDCEMVQGGLDILVEEDIAMSPSMIEGLRTAFSTQEYLPEYSNRKEWIMRTFAQRGGLRGFAMTAQNRLISKAFITANNLFFKDRIIHEDELWNYMLATHVTKLGICKKITYSYRIRGNSITTKTKTTDQKINERFPVWDAILDDLKLRPNKIFTKMLWGYMNEFWTSEMSSEMRDEFRKRLELLMQNFHFPTTIGLWFYIHRQYSSTFGNFFFRRMIHNSVRNIKPVTGI